MTDQAPAAPPQVIQFKDGSPCVVGIVEDVIPYMREQGYNQFYVLGATEEQSFTDDTGAKIVSDPVPRIFQVRCLPPLGYTMAEVDTNKATELKCFPANGWFEAPKIPWLMIQQMDAFFRAVDKELHTEAVVVLTYDPTKEGSEAWGFIVPSQENSAGHCDYKPESIIEEKDAHVLVAGTAHSHPGMKAYASGTDHTDQDKNDGLHITFGWNRGSNLTEYHCELTMGGRNYVFQPEQIFENIPAPPQVPEVAEWMKKVSKETFPKASQGSYASSASSTWPYQAKAALDPDKYYDQNGQEYILPEGCPDPKIVSLVVRLLDGEQFCPVCLNPFREDAKERRRCWECFAFFLVGDESLEDVRQLRLSKPDCPTHEIDPDKAGRPIAIWERKKLDDGSVEHSAIEVPGKELAQT